MFTLGQVHELIQKSSLKHKSIDIFLDFVAGKEKESGQDDRTIAVEARKEKAYCDAWVYEYINAGE